jgi:hypothetical protein
MKISKTIWCALFFFMCAFTASSQILFEKGYYVDNAGLKSEGLIKNIDWKNNPNEFEFKKTETEESKLITLKDAQEFGVIEKVKFLRFKVNIDRSSNITNEISNLKAPKFKEETLYLKTVIEGKATLYSFEDNNLTRFFIATDSLPVEQLVYKKYLIESGKMGYNLMFRQQLLNNLKCDAITMRDIEKAEYFTKDLAEIFVKYNQCVTTETFTDFNALNNDRKSYTISLRAGIGQARFELGNSLNGFNNEFNKINYRVGVEFEYFLPFNKNKWAIISEPSYQVFNGEGQGSISSNKVDFSSFDLGLGVRHYIFLPDNSKFFINASFNYGFITKGDIRFGSNYSSFLDVTGNGNLAAGIGYKRNKMSIELLHSFNRSLLSNYVFWGANFNATSIVFGYSIFN